MPHRGHKKAIVAAHAVLVTAYHLLSRDTTYHELGPDYYDRRHTERVTRRAVQALERQGYRVTLERVAEIHSRSQASSADSTIKRGVFSLPLEPHDSLDHHEYSGNHMACFRDPA